MAQVATAPCPRCGAANVGALGVCPRCAARVALEAEDDEGMRVGEYELREELGRGAMGAVYRARHTRLGREVALKVILAGSFAAAAERRRFLFEAEAVARLDHANIIPLYEHGEAEGRLFHAMRLIEGGSLAARLEGGPLPAREAVGILEKCARAVHHAHERGVLHRDLKPGNVLLDAAGVPHVADFGLARRTGMDSSLTLAGSLVGTPSYMAPELAAGGGATAGADVWSLGVMLYEMLTGKPPFTGASLPEVLLAVGEREPASLRAVVDRDLETVCLRCLEKDPARRYPTALALAEDLARWQRGEPVEARPVTGIERLGKWMRRRPAVTALAALAMIIFLAGLAGVIWQWRRANREADATRAALAHANESLWRANLDRARALRISRVPGQRFGALAAIREAAAFRATRELREEAVAAMALPDAGAEIATVALPEGARLAGCDGAGENIAIEEADVLRFLRLRDGAAWAEVPMQRAASNPADMSRDFSRAAVPRGARSAVVEVATGRVLLERAGCRGQALSTDGRMAFFADENGGLEAVDVGSGATLAKGMMPMQEGWQIAPEPGGGRLALWRGRRVAVADARDFSHVAEMTAGAGVLRCAWSADGALFVGADDAILTQWHPQTGARLGIVRHDREGVVPVAHTSGLLVASVAWDSMTKITAPAWGELLRVPGVRVSGFSDDGRRMVMVRDRSVVAVEFAPPDVWLPLALRPDLCRRVYFSPDGRWLAGLLEGEVVLWDAASQRLLAVVRVASPQDAVWEGGSSLLVGTNSALVRVRFSEKDGGMVAGTPETLFKSTSAGTGVALLPRGRVVFIGGTGIFSAADGRAVETFRPNPASNSLMASADGRWLAAGCWKNNGRPESYAAIWEPGRAEPVAKLPAGNSEVAFSPDGGRLIVAETNRYTEYECGSWRRLREWPRGSSGYDAVRPAFSPDGRLMTLAADEFTLRLLDAASGTELLRLASPVPRKVNHMEFSPDGRWLAVVSTGLAQLWDLRLMRERLREMKLDWE